MKKSPEQEKAEQMLLEMQSKHGFDPNAKVWIVNPNKLSFGYASNTKSYGSSIETAKQVIQAIKNLTTTKKGK